MSERRGRWVVAVGCSAIAGCGVGQASLNMIDVDGDGYVSASYQSGNDCDDDDRTVHPGRGEDGASCGDGKDQDCDEEDCAGELTEVPPVDADGAWMGYAITVLENGGGDVRIAISAPGAAAPVEDGSEVIQPRSGEVWLYDAADPSGEPLTVINSGPGELFGASLASTEDGALFVGAPLMPHPSVLEGRGGVALFIDPVGEGALEGANVVYESEDYSLTGINLAATVTGDGWLVATAAPTEIEGAAEVRLLTFSPDGSSELGVLSVGASNDRARHDLCWGDVNGDGVKDLFTALPQEPIGGDVSDWSVNLYLDVYSTVSDSPEPDWWWEYEVGEETDFGPALVVTDNQLYIGTPYRADVHVAQMTFEKWSSTTTPQVNFAGDLPASAGADLTSAWSYVNAADGDLLVFAAEADDEGTIGWRYDPLDPGDPIGKLKLPELPDAQFEGGVVATVLSAEGGGPGDQLVLGVPGVSSLHADSTLSAGVILLGPAWQ